MKRIPIKQRIVTALQENNGILEYQSLLYIVFPPDQYPGAYRNSSNGGPPGCAMALGRALREMSGQVFDSNHEYGRKISLRSAHHLRSLLMQ